MSTDLVPTDAAGLISTMLGARTSTLSDLVAAGMAGAVMGRSIVLT